MEGELTAEGVRAHSFRTGWRGYRRADVDQFRAEVAARLEYLENKITEATAKLEQLGIEDVQELSRELGKVGDDVSAILEEARRTSTDMRNRATEDAASWRREAESQARTMRSEAETAAEQLRSDAWREASRMVADARDEAENIVAGGRQDVLFIRAEAEREVMHLGGDARREADELVRNAQAESDQILAAAEAEAEKIVGAAERAVAGALERTRELEQRRTELIGEIDSAQLSLEALQGATAEEEHTGASTQDVAEVPWQGSEDGAVRIVAAPSLTTPGPVDADELVAEVEQLRSARLDDHAPEAVPTDDRESGHESVEAAVAEETEALADEAEAAPGPEMGPTDVAAAVEREPAEEGGTDDGAAAAPSAAADPLDAADSGAAATTEADHEDATQSGDAPRSGDAAESDATQAEDAELAGLFAQLRAPSTPPEAVVEDDEPEAPPEPAERSEEAVPPPRAVPISGPPGEGAFELRERLLLPIENASLREVKRHLVELQNRVLEELRTATGGWEPDPDEFLGEMSGGMAAMRSQAFAAGVGAVEQMTGRPAGSIEPPAGDPGTREFAESLIAAVSHAHSTAAAHDAGSRQLAAAVSRVFRAWRTDEAERQLRHAAYAAYHEGVLAGFVAVGVTAVTAVTEGVPCAECPAGREWAPGADPPSGSVLPPAHLGCVTTIVPAGMAG